MLWFVFPCVFCSVWSSLEFNVCCERLLHKWWYRILTIRLSHILYLILLSLPLNDQICGFVWIVKSPDERNPPPAAALTWLEPDSLYPPAFFLPGAVAGKIELASERHEEALEWTAALREQDEAKPISQAWMERAACSVSLEMDWPLFQSAVAVPWAEF